MARQELPVAKFIWQLPEVASLAGRNAEAEPGAVVIDSLAGLELALARPVVGKMVREPQ
jgi:hypothetical protein